MAKVEPTRVKCSVYRAFCLDLGCLCSFDEVMPLMEEMIGDWDRSLDSSRWF